MKLVRLFFINEDGVVFKRSDDIKNEITRFYKGLMGVIIVSIFSIDCSIIRLDFIFNYI